MCSTRFVCVFFGWKNEKERQCETMKTLKTREKNEKNETRANEMNFICDVHNHILINLRIPLPSCLLISHTLLPAWLFGIFCYFGVCAIDLIICLMWIKFTIENHVYCVGCHLFLFAEKNFGESGPLHRTLAVTAALHGNGTTYYYQIILNVMC